MARAAVAAAGAPDEHDPRTTAVSLGADQAG